MNATQEHKNLQEYFDGELNSDERLAFELHLTDCPACRAELQSLKDLSNRVSRLPREIEPAGDLWKNVEMKLKRKPYPFLNQRSEEFSGLIRAAAVLALVGMGGILWLFLSTEPGQVSPPEMISSQLSVKTDSVKSVPDVSRQVPHDTQARPERKVDRRTRQTTSAKLAAEKHDSVVVSTPSPAASPSIPGSTIAGRVLDESGQPLVGATVLLDGTRLGAVSDTSGRFVITGMAPRAYSVSISEVGFIPAQVNNVIVSDTLGATVNVTLSSAAVAMQMVEVTADLLIVSPLTTSSTTSSNITRGGRSGEVQYLVDGISGTPVPQAEADALKYGSGYSAELGNPRPPSQMANTEQYDGIVENEFLGSTSNPVSTFSIDVDNASYSNVRRFINDGQFPPKDAVRIEELINYFSYDYQQPENEHPFSITSELADCPWNSEHKLVLIGLQGKKIEVSKLPPSNLVFLIDVSGSMNEPNKLPLVKSAFRLLVQELRPQDRVAIVVYAGRAGMVLPSTPGSEKETILSAIDRLEAGGSTAGGEGLTLAYSVAKEYFLQEGNNRVILATDGDFNVGISSDNDLVRLIEERRDQGIYLSVLGFGRGNYKDAKMEKLADKGNGNYAYIDNIQEARKVFVGQMAGTIFTIAKDVKIQVEFNPQNVKAYRLIGYENRKLAREDFNNDRIDAGELGSGHSVTALYEIVPSSSSSAYGSNDPLKYQSGTQPNVGTFGDEAMTVKLRYKPRQEKESKLLIHVVRNEYERFGAASMNLRFASSVAEFGMLLRDSKFKSSSSYDHVINVSMRARGADPDGYRAEFVRLAQACRDLSR